MALRVTLLTQEQCAFCDQAKAILKRLAPEYGLMVETLDLAAPEGQALAEQSGMLFPPGILIEGQPFSYGRPSERALRQALDRYAVPGQQKPRT